MTKNLKIDKVINNLTIIVVLFFLVNQYFTSQVLGSNRPKSSGPKIELRNGATEGEIIQAVLPQNSDTVRPYKWQGQEVTLSAQVPGNGYDKLVEMNRLSLATPEQQQRYKTLTDEIYHPCCDVSISRCGCKHAVAAQGLIKFLLTEGYDDNQIKDEVFLWNRYWWPKHYATAAIYLNSQGSNPSTISTADWLGPSLSTIRSGRKMRAALGR